MNQGDCITPIKFIIPDVWHVENYRKFIGILLMEFLFFYSKFKCYGTLGGIYWYTVSDVSKNCCSFIMRRLRSTCIMPNANNSEPNQS